VTTPEASPADVAEQHQSPSGADLPAAAVPADGVPPVDSAPEADVLEQALDADPDEPAASVAPRAGVPLEADPADAVEQDLDVPFDEDEQR
jgi:hypothetical protein